MTPPCWVSKYHLTDAGPFVSIVPLILLGVMGPTQPPTLMVAGSICTVTLVTEALGISTTGIPARFPAVLVTLAATQQFLLPLSGSIMYHQLKSELLPVIWAVCPTVSPLMTIQPVPGPKRQLTETSFGNAIGIVGVDVNVGGGVIVGRGVSVGTLVGKGCVADGTGDGPTVGVSVTGTLDGRLQACKTSVRASMIINDLDFIGSPLLFSASYSTIIPLAIDHLDSVRKNVPKVAIRRSEPELNLRDDVCQVVGYFVSYLVLNSL
jgi:hypothetical protein